MSITRLNHFEAKLGREGELKDLLASIIGIVRGSPGCSSCQLLEAVDQATKLVIVEEWDNVQAHQDAAKLVPPEKLQAAVGLLAQRPAGEYYKQSGE